MRRIIKTVAACLVLLGSVCSAHASLVTNSDFTTATVTSLDWLDLDLSSGLSLNQANAQLGVGGLCAGYQVATPGSGIDLSD